MDEDETKECTDCEGSGEVTCPECEGTGLNEDGDGCQVCDGNCVVECETCNGSGEVDIDWIQ